MGRGLAYKHHQKNKRKTRKKNFYKQVWRSTYLRDVNLDAVHLRRYQSEPTIDDRFIGMVADTNVGGYTPRCRCDWCKPPRNKQLIRHIDSFGNLGDVPTQIRGDKWHGN